ncbi:hypothetical protein AB0M43_21240 [Longispora sp. NPDC051575]|uniref:hypothetical protein n=1 Tax=Longispora sp. NPDC051575 TaxID=3154943 RepID=UPI003419EEAD
MTRFILNGVPMELDAAHVARRLDGVRPEPVQVHAVRVGGVIFPVLQAFEVASAVPRSGFNSLTARRHLEALGFEVFSTSDRPAPGVGSVPALKHAGPAPATPAPGVGAVPLSPGGARPDYPRYRDLAGRTRTGRRAAGIHVVLVTRSGQLVPDTWTP